MESNHGSLRWGAIVVCGGRSSRMGSAKAWLPFGPELMLPRIVRILAAAVPRIVVVTAVGQALPELHPAASVVYDSHADRGPLEGIHAGLEALRADADAAFVCSCDLPLLQPDFIELMQQQLGAFDAAVPWDGSRWHPLAGVYRIERVLPHVAVMLANDVLRVTALFDRIEAAAVPLDKIKLVDSGLWSLTNVNTPADYEAALRAAGFAKDR